MNGHCDSWWRLTAQVYKELMPHQRAGVRWFWELYRMDKGGILGDDMVCVCVCTFCVVG